MASIGSNGQIIIPDLPNVNQTTQQNTGAFNLPTPQAPTSIQQNVDIASLVKDYQTSLGDSQPVISIPDAIAPAYEQYRPTPVQGLGQDFFEAQKQTAKESLREEFFGSGGLEQQTVSDESAAGRIGGGVAGQRIQQLVAEPFTKQYAQIERDSLMAQLEDQSQVRQLNAQLDSDFNKTLSTLMAKDSDNALMAEQANAELGAAYDELAVKLANVTSEQDLKLIELEIQNYESAIKEYQVQVDAAAKEKELEYQGIELIIPEGGEPRAAEQLSQKPNNIDNEDYEIARASGFYVPPDDNSFWQLVSIPGYNDGQPMWLDNSGQRAYDAKTKSLVSGLQGAGLSPQDDQAYIPAGYDNQTQIIGTGR